MTDGESGVWWLFDVFAPTQRNALRVVLNDDKRAKGHQARRDSLLRSFSLSLLCLVPRRDNALHERVILKLDPGP